MKILVGLSLAFFVMGCPEETVISDVDDGILADLAVRRDMSSSTADLLPGMTASVTIDDFFYAPQEVVVSRGGTVTWTWRGAASHTATADDGATFVSPEQTTGTFSHTFTAAGSFPYHCQVHGTSMSGTVTVR